MKDRRMLLRCVHKSLGSVQKPPQNARLRHSVWFCPGLTLGAICAGFPSVRGRKGGQGFGLIKHEAGKAVSLYVGLVLARASVSSETWFHFTPLWHNRACFKTRAQGVGWLFPDRLGCILLWPSSCVTFFGLFSFTPATFGLISIRWVDN